MNEPKHARPFRFFDNREKYLLFVTTCSEKWAISQRIGVELPELSPAPPALRVFDAGTGDGTVMASVLRQLHGHFHDGRHLLVLLEFQTRDGPRMALRILAYTSLLYQELARNAPWRPDDGGRLPRVLPVVVYNGATPWRAAKEVNELVQPVEGRWRRTGRRSATGCLTSGTQEKTISRTTTW